ncbi:MAG: cytoplasmic protein [Deltaproteobacteria bacterium]|nr:MAG: cytoplasmic protein [Deltaproteobacteria bacterium]
MPNFGLQTQREWIKTFLHLGGCVLGGGPLINALADVSSTHQDAEGGRFIVLGKGRSPQYSISELVKQTFEASGGMSRFISRGHVVAVKPNISWARTPDLAATTNPEVLKTVVELCFDAGAKQVKIVDHTIHDPRRCFALTGAGKVAKETGAELIYPRSSLVRRMKVGGKRVDVWPVLRPLVEADKIINIPIAKHHSLSSLTLGMKNWIGGVGGRRWALHQDIHQSIVDLARFFNPSITLIDAIRIMTSNGPSGGSLKYVVTNKRESPVSLFPGPGGGSSNQ